jgi:hypothetical protein
MAHPAMRKAHPNMPRLSRLTLRRRAVAGVAFLLALALSGMVSGDSTMTKRWSRSASAIPNANGDSARDSSQPEPPSKTSGPWSGRLLYRGFDWDRVGAKLPGSPSLRALLLGFSGQIDKALSDPIQFCQRATKLSDIPPGQLDARHAAAGANAETFALAMADCAQGDYLRTQGVALAVYARLLRREDCLNKCILMLKAFSEHSPLQRPGWTAYTPDVRLPNGGDGVWLGTAWGIQGIVEMLFILGDRVPAELRADLCQLLQREVERVRDDWTNGRPWYVKTRAHQSNQWIEVSAALARACLYLGQQRNLDAYNLAVESLARTLETLGQDGAFVEGVTYASMTEGSLFDAIGLIRGTGDSRLDQFDFVRQAWKWWMHMTVPGAQYVNCNDSRMSVIPEWARRTPLPSMFEATRHGGGPDALRQLLQAYPESQPSVLGIQYTSETESLTPTGISLPTHAYFPTQELLVWRSRWEMPSAPSQAWSLWVRGGSRLDSHSHRDQGHVSVQNGDHPVLLDCGTPDYSNPDLDRKFASAAGHNVLQIGELAPRNAVAVAPITVQALSDAGGELSIDCSAAFPATKSYTRTITWERQGRIQIRDRIVFREPTRIGSELLRFHTGATTPLRLASDDEGHSAQWATARLTFVAKPPVSIRQGTWPDAIREPFLHTMISLDCLSASTEYDVQTEIQLVPQEPPTQP